MNAALIRVNASDKRLRTSLLVSVFVCLLGRLQGFSTVPCAFKHAGSSFQPQTRRAQRTAISMKEDHGNKMVPLRLAVLLVSGALSIFLSTSLLVSPIGVFTASADVAPNPYAPKGSLEAEPGKVKTSDEAPPRKSSALDNFDMKDLKLPDVKDISESIQEKKDQVLRAPAQSDAPVERKTTGDEKPVAKKTPPSVTKPADSTEPAPVAKPKPAPKPVVPAEQAATPQVKATTSTDASIEEKKAAADKAAKERAAKRAAEEKVKAEKLAAEQKQKGEKKEKQVQLDATAKEKFQALNKAKAQLKEVEKELAAQKAKVRVSFC
eukprot:747107-Hanusia_phi.AAC.6